MALQKKIKKYIYTLIYNIYKINLHKQEENTKYFEYPLIDCYGYIFYEINDCVNYGSNIVKK